MGACGEYVEPLLEVRGLGRRFGGLHPLCGIGVTSRMAVISSPTACSVRTAGMLRLCSTARRSGIGPMKAPS